MKRNSTKRAWFTGPQKLALGVGTLAATVALYVLTEDAIKSGAWTTTHVIMPAALVITIAAGKLLYAAISSRVVTSSLGFAFVFAMGTAIVVLNSVGKQAESYDAKTAAVTQANERIEAVKAEIQETKAKLEKAETAVARQINGVRKKSGRGWLVPPGCGNTCEGWKLQVATHTTAIQRLKAELAEAGPALKLDPKSSHWAEIAIVTGIASEQQRGNVVKAIALVTPVLQTLLLELAACWCIGFAFYRPNSKKVVSIADHVVMPDPTPGSRKTRKEEALADLLQFKRPVRQNDLSHRWGVSEGLVSGWLSEFEAEGSILRFKDGRFNLVQCKPKLEVVAS